MTLDFIFTLCRIMLYCLKFLICRLVSLNIFIDLAMKMIQLLFKSSYLFIQKITVPNLSIKQWRRRSVGIRIIPSHSWRIRFLNDYFLGLICLDLKNTACTNTTSGYTLSWLTHRGNVRLILSIIQHILVCLYHLIRLDVKLIWSLGL